MNQIGHLAPRNLVLRMFMVLALLTGGSIGTIVAAPTAHAAIQHGPAPTNASIEATRGPFATAQTTVSRFSASGFGGGTIYYPTTTAEGTFGGVAMAPGYTASQSSLAWLGPRLASQGFVIFIIDTNSRYDQPSSRATQLMSALRYLTNSSSVRTRVDASRLAVMGHSMGGGGTLEASASNPQLQAAIPLTPWDSRKSFSGSQVPTLIIGAQNDSVAPVSSHSVPFYNSLPNSPGKAYLELRGASHFAPNSANTTIAKYSISWLKLFVDDDTRYQQFVCPGPGTGTAISVWRQTCP